MYRNRFVVICSLILCYVCNLIADLHPDTGLGIDSFLEKYGYPLESHEIETEDGYILTMHRIPNPDGKPILLMHGVGSSSIDWINSGPNKSLGLILADRGCDVWMGNQRGNTYSRKHVLLNPDVHKKKFWDFSFHEIGFYDLAAKIDYILFVTGHSKVHYAGISQGTTTFFALTASRPEYNDKIESMSALSPVIFIKGASSPVVKIAGTYFKYLGLALKFLKLYEVAPLSHRASQIINKYCCDGSDLQDFCAGVYHTLSGFAPLELNKTMLTVYGTNAPAGVSKKQLIHYLQMYSTGGFKQYNYGWFINLVMYKQRKPPDYDVSKITAPVYFFYGDKDFLAPVKNVEQFADLLPNVKKRKLFRFHHQSIEWTVFSWVFSGLIKTVFKQ